MCRKFDSCRGHQYLLFKLLRILNYFDLIYHLSFYPGLGRGSDRRCATFQRLALRFSNTMKIDVGWAPIRVPRHAPDSSPQEQPWPLGFPAQAIFITIDFLLFARPDRNVANACHMKAPLFWQASFIGDLANGIRFRHETAVEPR